MHKKYTKAEAQRKKWIMKDSPAFTVLESVVLDKKTLAGMPHFTQPFHAGSVDVFHSLINMYASKSQEFDMHVMDARIKLAVVDYNSNLNRKQAVITKKTGGWGKRWWKKNGNFNLQKDPKSGCQKKQRSPSPTNLLKSCWLI